MSKNWILVADAAHARIFAQDDGTNDALTEQHRLTHPESQLHEGDLRTGGKGEMIESTGASSHQPDPQTTTMEKHAESFAKQLCDVLKRGRVDNAYEQLILVAEPQLLGRLRDNLDSATSQLVKNSIDKNWAQHDREQIQKLLQNK